MSDNSLGSLLTSTLLSGAAFLAANELQGPIAGNVDVGVSAPYLPAGVRLVAVVVFGPAGAVGLFGGSLFVAPDIFPQAGPAALLAIAAVNGFVPLFALAIVRSGFGIGEHLRELSFRSLMALIALISLLSPVAHQLLFLVSGVAPASLFNLLAMIAGDVVGCMLVTLVFAAVWRVMRGG